MTDSENSETPLPGIKLVELNADHLPTVVKIEKASFHDPWPLSAFRDLMVQARTSWAAIIDDEVAGYLVTQWVLDEIHILNIAVAVPYRRKGIASHFLDFLMTRGRQKKMRDLFLEVRASNESAKSLYAKYGFQNLSSRRAYYADGEDALVLHRRIPSTRQSKHEGDKHGS